MAKINNVAYSWSLISLTSTALGVDADSSLLSGVTEIEWKRERKIEDNYGLHGKKTSRGIGNEKTSASVTMDYATQLALRKLAGGSKGLMGLGQFDLTISFAGAMGDAAMGDDWTTETVVLKGCMFNEDGMESKQDDTNISSKFSLNPFAIDIVSA